MAHWDNDIIKLGLIYEAIQTNEPSPQRLRDAIGKFKNAKISVGDDDYFFADFLIKLLPDDVANYVSNATQTMATNGRNIIYNPEFVIKHDHETLKTVIVHEILHVAYGHHKLFKEIVPANDPELWQLANVAGDLSINHLIQTRHGTDILLRAGEGDFKDFPIGEDAATYYKLLIKKFTKQPEQPQQPDQPDQPQQPTDGKDEEGEDGEDGEEGQKDRTDAGSEAGDQADDEAGQEGGEEGGDEGGEGGEEGSEGGEGGEDREGGEGGEGGEEGGDGGGEGGEEGGEGGDEGGQGGKGGKSTPNGKDGKGGQGGEEGGDEVGQGGKGGKQRQPRQSTKPDLEIPQHIIDQMKQSGQVLPADENEKPYDEQDVKTELEETVNRAETENKQREEQMGGSGGGASQLLNRNFSKIVREKKKPVLNWNQILPVGDKRVRDYRTFAKPNRRQSFEDFATGNMAPFDAPSMQPTNKVGEILFIVDVSGSMDPADINSTFKHISDITASPSWAPETTLRLITFDTEIMSEKIFSGNKQHIRSVMNPGKFISPNEFHKVPLNPKEYENFQWGGYGRGTQIWPVFQKIQAIIKPKPEVIIVLTDGGFTYRDKEILRSKNIRQVLTLTNIKWLMTSNTSERDYYPNIGTTYKLKDYASKSRSMNLIVAGSK